MSRRPTDWSPLAGSDPVSGDPDEIERAARSLTDVAEEITRQAANLKRLATAEGWDADAGRTFADSARDLAGQLDKAHGRYATAGGALKGYAPELRYAQQVADTALVEAKQAEATVTTHQPPSHPPAGPPTPEEAAADRRRQYAYDEGVTALHAAQRKLADAVDHRDRAEGRAAGAIRETIDNDGLKDSWWDKFKNWVHEHADLLKAIAKIAELVATILSIIALAISWIPVLDFLSPILLGLAALASGVALVCNLALALAGDGSWLDVAADLFAVVTFGFGAYAASEARAARIAAEEEEVAAQEAAEEAARLRRLGEDPATGTFRQSEMETAQRVKGARGVKLERSTDPKVDWVGSDGKTYDAVGNFPAKYFNKQWPNLQTRILDHLQKADYVPIDISQFTPAQIAMALR